MRQWTVTLRNGAISRFAKGSNRKEARDAARYYWDKEYQHVQPVGEETIAPDGAVSYRRLDGKTFAV